MSKQEFLEQLRKGLSGLPRRDIDERLDFYSEMIDDRMEEGLSEEEAVREIGDVDALVSQIVAEIPLTRLVKEKITPRKRLKAWEMVLLVLGSPLWLSLTVAGFAVLLSLYVVLWAVVVSLWAVFASFMGGAFGGLAAGIVFVCNGNLPTGIGMIGAGLVCAGLSIFLFYGCKAATKGTLWLTKRIVLGIKSRFVKKEEA